MADWANRIAERRMLKARAEGKLLGLIGRRVSPCPIVLPNRSQIPAMPWDSASWPKQVFSPKRST